MTRPNESSVVTVFRSRLRDDVPPEYADLSARLGALASEIPGFVEYKRYQAADGDRVTIVVFESRETLRVWTEHPEHRAAMKRGRDEFYEWYWIETFDSQGARRWERSDG